MNNNKLIIAVAGSGKTTRLVNEALNIKSKKVLITTYTIANETEIKNKIINENKKQNGLACIPTNITVQTWFSFLLQHGVRPFQSALFSGLFLKKINGLVLVNKQSSQYTKESTLTHYFTNELKIYSDKISKFIFYCNKITKGNVIDRISKIYSHIFIDEVQDLAGYDLELLKLFFDCSSNILLVGDPRQVVYLTHNERKYKKYTNGKIKEFIENECNKDCCKFEFLIQSYRCNQTICDFSDKLYPNFPKTISKNKYITKHDGIFFIKETDVEKYLAQYEPMLLRYSKKTPMNEKYKENIKTYGESKGLSFDRVLIYPTAPMLKWIKDINSDLADTSRSKFYVAITRAKYSVGIVVKDKEKSIIDGITYFKPI